MSHARTSALRGLLLRCAAGAVAALASAACDQSTGRASKSGGAEHATSGERTGVHGASHSPLRIASLSPALTQCVIELGAGDALVGRTPWCEGAGESVPVIGTLLDIDAESLVRARPSCILVQPPAQGMDPGLTALAGERGWTVMSWRIDGIDDASQAMRDIAAMVASALPERAPDVAAALARWQGGLESAMAPVGAGAGSPAPRVLVLVGGAEGVAFGGGTYVSDALSRMGCVNALPRTGYPALSAEDVIGLRPDIAVVLGAPGTSVPLLVSLQSALPGLRVERIEGRELLVPGGGLPRGLGALRAAIMGRPESPSSGDGHGR